MNTILEALRTAHECIVMTSQPSSGNELTDRALIDKAIAQLEFSIEAIMNGYPHTQAENEALKAEQYEKRIDEEEDRANDYD